MKKFFLIVAIAGTFASCKQTQPQPNCDDLQRVQDSLAGEIFTLTIDNGRYEVILDRIREIDSVAVDNAMKNIE
jgi:hypothetical protein